MESPIPRPLGLEPSGEPVPTSTLKRKGSTLQTSVEVFRCKFGKPARVAEGDKSFLPSKDWTPLYYAIYHQREAALTHFLRTGGSPNDVTGVGQPPLCVAVSNGNIGIIRILLEAGADIDAHTRDGGETALHLAAKNGRSDIVDLVLAAGARLDKKTTETGDTPLHYAAERCASLATIVALLRMGAKYDALNASGRTPAEVALDANHLHGAVAIINAAHGRRNKLTKEKEMLLKHVQKTQGRFSLGNDLIADIFTAACDPDSNVLVEAIQRDDHGLVEMFLEKGSDPDRLTARGDRPIFVAIECAGPAVILALVKHNTDLSIKHKGLTVLQAAFAWPHAQDEKAMSTIFDAFLNKGADASVAFPDGKTLLHLAVDAKFGHARVVNLLINAGVEVNAQDSEGSTALHLAARSRSCVDILLTNGANPRQINNDGLAPLLYAITQSGKAEEPDLESLIKSSDLRETNSHAQTALHIAASRGLAKTTRLLLRARAETTVVDFGKNTPLLLAVKHQQWSVVPLLTIPPSVNSWDQDGVSALHHIAKSFPNGASSWEDIAAAAMPFCERGVSRSMRDLSGATPLIQAVKTLPEQGLPVIEALLVQNTGQRASWNCVSHEDHQKCDALYYAITLKKPAFVEVLLKHGATFTLGHWSKGSLNIAEPSDAQVLMLLSQYEWKRRAESFRSGAVDRHAENAAFSSVFPAKDLREMVSIGLQVDNLPRTPLGTTLLWAILRQVPREPSMSSSYLFEILKLVIEAGADLNVSTVRGSKFSRSPPSPRASKESLPLALQPLTFLLEEHPSVDINIVTLFLKNGAKVSIASPFYGDRFPLHSAARANRIDIVDEILLQRADANCKDKMGRTPLFTAAEKGTCEMIHALLRHGAAVDISDATKNTPLYVAAIGGNKKIVEALLNAGAKGSAKNARELMPLACVSEDLEEKEKDGIIELLKNSVQRETSQLKRQKLLTEPQAVHQTITRQWEEVDTGLQQRIQEGEEKHCNERNLELRPTEAQDEAQIYTEPAPASPLHEKAHSKSLFSKPSLLFSRSKHATLQVSSMPKQPSMISIRIHTPTFSKTSTAQHTQRSIPTLLRANSSVNTQAPTSVTNESCHVTVVAESLRKPLPIPLMDVGIEQADPNHGSTLPPALNKNQAALGDDTSTVTAKQRESGHELKDWLALSKMMENL